MIVPRRTPVLWYPILWSIGLLICCCSSLLFFSTWAGAMPVWAQSKIAIDLGPTVEVVQGNPATVTLQVTSSVNVINVNVQADCDAAPTRISGDYNNNLVLEPNETWRYLCTIANPTVTFNLFGSVTAYQQSNQQLVTGSDATRVVVLHPGIHLTKSVVTPLPLLQGQSVTFTLDLRNTGLAPVHLNDITLADPLCVGGPRLQPQAGVTDNYTLDADPDGEIGEDINGETWRYLCTVANVQDDFTNTATVQVTTLDGQPFAHSAQAAVEVLRPALVIEKAAELPTVTAGAPMTWRIQLFNTGELPFRDVKVTESDPLCPTVGPIQPGPQSPVIQGDFNNNGIWDPSEIWSFRCTRTYQPNVSNPVRTEHNQATVTAMGTVGGRTYGPSSTNGSVTVITERTLAIVQEAPTQPVLVGQNLTLPISVTNRGSVGLAQVQVDAPLCSSGPTYQAGDTNEDGILAPDNAATPANEREVWRYSCIVANVQQAITSLATATAVDMAGNAVDAVHSMITVSVAYPGLNLTNVLSGTAVVQGESATFALQVTNRGAGELRDLKLYAPDCDYGLVVGPFFAAGAPNDGDNRLDPGEVWDYRCSRTNVQRNVTNTALVTARDPYSTVQQAAATTVVNVQMATLALTQTPAYSLLPAGAPVTLTIVIENRGIVALSPVNDRPDSGLYAAGLYAPLCTTITPLPETQTPGLLSPGESWHYQCRIDGTVTARRDKLENFVAAAFRDATGQSHQVENVAHIQLLPTALALQKVAVPPLTLAGNPVSFRYVVRNASAQPLSQVSLTDPTCPAPPTLLPNSDVNLNNQLEPDEVWAYTCQLPTLGADLHENWATITAQDSMSQTVQARAAAPVRVLAAGMTLHKDTPTPLVQQGAPVLFTIDAFNLDQLNLLNVAVKDPRCQPDALPSVDGDLNGDGKLSPGEQWHYACVVPAAQQAFTNTATLTGQLEYNVTVITRTASSAVTVLGPALELRKTTATPHLHTGEDVTFTLQVRNAGSTPLQDITLYDPQCDVGPTPIDASSVAEVVLLPGTSQAYRCLVDNVQVAFTNTATVTAQSSTGSVLTATAQAAVTVEPVVAGITLTKLPISQTVTAGASAHFTLTVANTGTVPVQAVTLVDPHCAANLRRVAGDGNQNEALDVSEQWQYRCQVDDVQVAFTNVATVTARSPQTTVLNATATAAVHIAPEVCTEPLLSLLKEPKTQTVTKGNAVNFTMSVWSGCDATLTAVNITDPLCNVGPQLREGDVNNNRLLDAGERWRYACTVRNVRQAFTNRAVARATTADAQTLRIVDRATVKVRSGGDLDIVVPDSIYMHRATTMSLVIEIVNLGTTPMHNVQAAHNLCLPTTLQYTSGDVNINNLLDSAERWRYTCTIAELQGESDGLVTVTALTATGEPIESSAVTVITTEEENAPLQYRFLPLITR